MSISVHIISAEESLFTGKADFIVATANEGELGIKKGHAPLLAFLKPGEVRLSYDDPDKQSEFFYISGGFLEVQPHEVTILADVAVRAKDIDEAAAVEAEKRARKAISDKDAEIDYARELAAIAEATARLSLLRKLKKQANR